MSDAAEFSPWTPSPAELEAQARRDEQYLRLACLDAVRTERQLDNGQRVPLSASERLNEARKVYDWVTGEDTPRETEIATVDSSLRAEGTD